MSVVLSGKARRGARRGVEKDFPRTNGAARRRSQTEVLRAALRRPTAVPSRENQLAVEDAAAPLMEAFFRQLFPLCRKMARSAPHLHLDEEDLAALAWQKVLRYLAGPHGDRVRDDEHFGRLLGVAARSAFLDALGAASNRLEEMDKPLDAESGTATHADLVADPAAITDALFLPKDSPYLLVVEELFTDAQAFRRTYQPHRGRHPRHYQALVLYQIALHWREAAGAPGAEDARMAAYIRHWLRLLGVPPEHWEPIEDAAREPELDEAEDSGLTLLTAVNRVCGTKLRGTSLRVLRHEMNSFAATRARRITTAWDEGED